MTPGLGVGWAEHVLERHWGSDTLVREPREQTTPQGRTPVDRAVCCRLIPPFSHNPHLLWEERGPTSDSGHSGLTSGLPRGPSFQQDLL